MKTSKDFDFGKWLLQRSEKESTKTVNFGDLTKKEKVETLLNLLGQTDQDFEDVQILGTESRQYSECSSAAKNAILMQECTAAIAEKRAPNLPKETDLVEVPVKTGFLSASLVAKINYLNGLYGKPIETVTVNLPCGEAWVSGLIAYCKGLETEKEA